MSTIVLNCPQCAKPIKVPADAVGKKVRCKHCSHVFVAQAPGGAPAAGPREAVQKAKAKPARVANPAKPAGKPGKTGVVDEPDEEGAYGVTDTVLGARCPQCASEMEEGGVICLGCGYNTQTRVQQRMRKIKDVTGFDKFLWLLPGILCVLGIFAIIGYCCYHHFGLPYELVDNWDKLVEEKGGRNGAAGDEASGAKGYLFHGAIELWIFIIGALICWRLGRFAVKRLIFNNQPPEVELR
jgi:predicted Zn finger-like uncharacterized protein